MKLICQQSPWLASDGLVAQIKEELHDGLRVLPVMTELLRRRDRPHCARHCNIAGQCGHLAEWGPSCMQHPRCRLASLRRLFAAPPEL